jgi:hypothetical protein
MFLRVKKFGHRSAAELGKKLGLKPAYYPKIESGELWLPNKDIFDQLIEEYRKPVDWATPLNVLYDLMKTGAIHGDPHWVAMEPFFAALQSIPIHKMVVHDDSPLSLHDVLNPLNRLMRPATILVMHGKLIRHLQSADGSFPDKYYATNFSVTDPMYFDSSLFGGTDVIDYDGVVLKYGSSPRYCCTADRDTRIDFASRFYPETDVGFLSREEVKDIVDKYLAPR